MTVLYDSIRSTSIRTKQIQDAYTNGFRMVASPLLVFSFWTTTHWTAQSNDNNIPNNQNQFLDSLHFTYSKSLWRHAITTTDNNTEIKVWCCSTWECTQTINFKSQNLGTELLLHAEIDRTSSYLVLSDMKNRGLYVLQIQKNVGTTILRNSDAMLSKRLNNTSLKSDEVTASSTNSRAGSDTTLIDNEVSKETKSFAYIKSISEFPLSSPILSFGIVDAAVRKYKCAFNDSYLIDELDDYDEDNHLLYCVVIHMFLVQPKSVQECHVLYQPTVSEASDVASSISEGNNGELNSSFVVSTDGDSAVVLDQQLSLEEISLTDRLMTPQVNVDNNTATIAAAISPKVIKTDNNVIHPNLGLPPAKPAGSINLMTPDSFNSPGKYKQYLNGLNDLHCQLISIQANTHRKESAGKSFQR